MSLPTQDPVKLLALGKRLQPLREEGVPIIGSGFLTHGLTFRTELRIDAPAPGLPWAHPTVEHHTPLFVTLGAATTPDEAPVRVIDGFRMGLSKRSLRVT